MRLSEAIGIGGDADHPHVLGLGLAALVVGGVTRGQCHGIADVHAQLFDDIARQRDFVAVDGPAAFGDVDRQQFAVPCGGDGLAADIVACFGDGYAAFQGDPHAVDAFDAVHPVEVEVTDGRRIHVIQCLLTQPIGGGADRIVRLAEHGGRLAGKRIIHGVAEQESAGDERRADHDGDAGRDEHASGLAHEFYCDGPHGCRRSFFRFLNRCNAPVSRRDVHWTRSAWRALVPSSADHSSGRRSDRRHRPRCDHPRTRWRGQHRRPQRGHA